MNFPVWDLGFAHGLLIAVVGILHVYVSHFAVGGGLFLVVTETLARRREDPDLLDYLHRHARFFILLTLVFGAISGVGIWFTIGLINPAGTSSLIHAFVWGWAIEWVFFITEIAAALVYYYGWNRLAPRTHLAVGWIYFLAAWLSMVIINGILSFQLTPGAWMETRNFWDGFFNPTYFPSLLSRTFFALALAGLFALLTAARMGEMRLRPWLMRYSATWSLVGLVGCVLMTLWWWHAVPEEIRAVTHGDMPFATMVMTWMPILTGLLALLVLVGPLALPRLVRMPAALVIVVVGLLLMGGGEWIREAVRKPWVIHGFLYSSGFRHDQIDELREMGVVGSSDWIDPAAMNDPVALGGEIFRIACGNCHARTGYNGMRTRVRHWDAEQTAAMIQRLEHMRRRMPPWVGTRQEAEALAAYLMTLKDPSPEPPPAGGEAVFQIHCSSCHSVDGFRALRELVEGLTDDDLDEYLTDMESDVMPPFFGSDAERRALAEWLARVGAGVEDEVVKHGSLDPELIVVVDDRGEEGGVR